MSVAGGLAPSFRVSGLDDGGLERTLAQADAGAFVIDDEGRIVLWNHAAEEIMGYSSRELIGRRCGDVFGTQNGDGHQLCCRGCQLAGSAGPAEPIRTFDLHTRTKEGKPVWINVGALACRINGAERSTIHLFCDVTKSRALLQRVHERLPRSDAGASASPALTGREGEVLRLMTLGMSTAAAASQLGISPATLRNHVQNIFVKLGVHSRLEAVAYASRHRMF